MRYFPEASRFVREPPYMHKANANVAHNLETLKVGGITSIVRKTIYYFYSR